jgi:hypothetical protein
MSFLSSLLPWTTAAVTDVEAAAKAIQVKADADIAKLRSSAVVTAAVADVQARMRAFDTMIADYKAKLQADLVKAAAVKAATPTGPTGATGA